jgi:hypothetical protein
VLTHTGLVNAPSGAPFRLGGADFIDGLRFVRTFTASEVDSSKIPGTKLHRLRSNCQRLVYVPLTSRPLNLR